MIEEVEEDERGMVESRPQLVSVEEGEEEIVGMEGNSKSEISLHALIGSNNTRTMRVIVKVAR